MAYNNPMELSQNTPQAPSHPPLPLRLLLLGGLGMVWASEELVTFCVSRSLLVGTDTSLYLYFIYLPLFALVGLAYALSPRLDKLALNSVTQTVLLALGIVGIFIIGLAPSSLGGAIVGVALFTTASVSANILWLRELTEASAETARNAIAAVVVITALLSLLWPLGDIVVLVGAAILLAGGFVTLALFPSCKEQFASLHSKSTCTSWPPQGLRAWLAPCGVLILMMSFGFLQYTAYHFSTPYPFGETVAHLLAAALVLLVLFAVQDTEFSFAMKLAATLMLFSFVLLAVSPQTMRISVVLAAATEGMLEPLVVLALVTLATASGADPFRLFGIYTVCVGVTQILGCLLAIGEHAIWPSLSYSVFGLGLVALLIITAVWLLNDKTVNRFLWGDATAENASDADARSFDEKAQDVAQAHGLTARETEVMALFAKGRSSAFIAEAFCVSNNTVRSHILHLYAKCNVHSRQELISLIDRWDDASD